MKPTRNSYSWKGGQGEEGLTVQQVFVCDIFRQLGGLLLLTRQVIVNTG